MLSIKHVIYLTLFIALSGLVALVVQLNKNNSSSPQIAQVEMVQLLSVKHAVEPRHPIKGEDLKWINVTKNSAQQLFDVIEKSQFDMSKIKNKVLIKALSANEHLHLSDLISPNDSDYITTMLAPNKRAIAINVDAKSAIAGLVQPGDYVDVMFYHKLSRRDNRDVWKIASSGSARQLVSNVRLLAKDNKLTRINSTETALGAEKGEEQEKFNEQSTVTLEVDIEQAQKLSLAQNLGQLSLLLRGKEQLTTANIMPAKASSMADVLNQFDHETEQSNLMLFKGNQLIMPNVKQRESN